MKIVIFGSVVALLAMACFPASLHAQDDRDKKIEQLQKEVDRLRDTVKNIQSELDGMKQKQPDAAKEPVGKPATDKGAGEFIKVAVGSMKIGGLIQVWYHNTENDPESDANVASEPDGFRFRRVELKLTGEVIPEVGYTVMIDPARAIGTDETTAETKRILQDAYITYHLNKVFDLKNPLKLDVGQYKIPVSLEGIASSAKLDLPERAIISRTFGDKRDIGAMFSGTYVDGAVEYQLGIFNGAGKGQNRVRDENDQEHVAARVAVRPFKILATDADVLKEFHVGVSRIQGDQGSNGSEGMQYRTGAELAWVYKEWTAKYEYLRGQDYTGIASVRSDGWYALGGYELKGLAPSSPALKDMQLVFRYEVYDPDRETDDDETTGTSMGINYFIDGQHAKIQTSFTHVDEAGDEIDNDEIIVSFQVYF